MSRDERRSYGRNAPPRWHLWIVATLAALTFAGADSTARLRAIRNVTNLRIDTSPTLQEDPSTVTGYAANQHRLIMPAIGMDGYNWIMQAERMVARTEGWRVRHVDYDHPPDGRDVEWSGGLHWEVAALAWLGTYATAIELSPDGWVGQTRDLLFGPYRPGGLSMSLAMERVASWTNTVNLVLLLLVTVPLVAWRFGHVSASLLALGFVLIYPFYQFFSIGYFDHHGLAATWDLLMVVCLVAGGAGWLRAEAADVSLLRTNERQLWNWLPTRLQARRWFVASAAIGGAGLWESAASTVPAMIGIGLGAVGSAWLGRGLTANSAWQVDATLWRTWGRVGCAASLAFYFLEYFPSHLGWNLEVNHPLYALAWLGAGDLICRSCEWVLRDKPEATPLKSPSARVLIVMDLLMVAALPVIIALTSKYRFRIADSFLWSLCADYILENQPLSRQLASMTTSEIVAHVSVLPLVLLPTVALLWKVDLRPTARVVWRVLLVLLLLPGLLFAHVISYSVIAHAATGAMHGVLLAHLLALVPDLLIVALLFGVPIYAVPPALPLPWKGLLILAVFPAVVLLVLSLGQSRWLGASCALWLGALMVVALVCVKTNVLGPPLLPVRFVMLAVLLLPFPGSTIAQWMGFGLKMPLTQMDLTEVVTRDASYRLRQRLGKEPGVIVSGPSTTTWMVYFGGFKGLGTLYQENLDGLKAVASIYSAASAEDALTLCRKYGVTHLAIYSWDAFAEEYARLWRGLRRFDPPPADAFILRVLRDGRIPNWLRPIPYLMPRQSDFANEYVLLFEVAPDQTAEEAAVHVAQYLWEKDKPEEATKELRNLLARVPDYLPALVCLARVQQAGGNLDAFHQTMAQVRANLAKASTMGLDDRVDLATVMALDRDDAQVRDQITAVLQHADERSLRHLLPDTLINLVGLARQMKLREQYAQTYQMAFDLLPSEAKGVLR